jgi:hypothetical protein
MERRIKLLPMKGIETKNEIAIEIQENWNNPQTLAMFEDYSEQFSDDYPNLDV